MIHVATCVHVEVFLIIASSHVRTEPQSVIGHTGGKKIPYVATLRSGRTQCMKRHFFINSSCQSATFVSSLRGKKIWKFSTQSKKQLAKMQQKKNVQWVVLMTEVPFPKPAIDALQGSAKPAGRGHASDAKRVGTEQRHAATLKLEVFGNCPQLRKDWKLQKIKIIETKFKAGVNGSLKLQCLFEALYLKPNLQGGTRFNWLRVHFWTPVQRKRVSKKGSLDCVLVLCQIFFSVQRLHGFRQVVQHVQLHVAN